MVSTLRKLPKPLIFAAFGALGGILGAVCGEVLFLVAASPPREIPSPSSPAKAVCLLLDCSGSMRGEKLAEVKKSAEDFAARQDLGKHEIAVVGFESAVYPVCPPTHDLGLIQAGVRQLTSAGGTEMAQGLAQAGNTLQNSPLEKHILLFTDGMPNSKEDTLREAGSLRAAGIGIVVVATADADRAFLSRLTGSPDRVMTTRMGSFGEAFHRAEEVIYRGLIDHSSVSRSAAIVRTVGWSALLAVPIGLLLVLAQNAYLRRKLVTARNLCFAILGGGFSGALAGLVGQYAYVAIGSLGSASRGMIFSVSFLCLGLMLWRSGHRRGERKAEGTWRRAALWVLVILVGALLLSPIVLSSAMIQDALSRTVGLALLGSLVGLGLALFIPNLGKVKGLIGGLVGGLAAGVLFVWISHVLSDAGARMTGAVALGACIGYMIALVESAWREAYLEVEWGPDETSVINLGDKTILLGSSSDCHVYLRDFPPVAATVTLTQGRIAFEDKTTGQAQELHDGNKLKIGTLTIHVHAHK